MDQRSDQHLVRQLPSLDGACLEAEAREDRRESFPEDSSDGTISQDRDPPVASRFALVDRVTDTESLAEQHCFWVSLQDGYCHVR